MDDIVGNNSEAKIVPRFVFETWNGEELKHFLTSTQRRCGQAIVDFLLVGTNFRSSLLNYAIAAQSNVRSSDGDVAPGDVNDSRDGSRVRAFLARQFTNTRDSFRYLVEIIESWSALFEEAELVFILPMTAPLGQKYHLFLLDLFQNQAQ